jgi:Small-conductance mechanosensitive channel
VKIGEIEGTVEQLGFLSLKIKTERREAITIPNALVVSTSTINYSRFAAREGVKVSTSVTIGYNTPWRQVEALLMLAANRTPGIRKEPPPVVRQTALLDFYVKYTVLVVSWTSRGSACRSCTRFTGTSSMPSTSTASRSHRRTTNRTRTS